MKAAFFILVTALLIFSMGCKREPVPEVKQASTALNKQVPLPPPPPAAPAILPKPAPTVHLRSADPEIHSWLRSTGSEDTIKIILALNRVDAKHLFRLDTLVVPDSFLVDLNRYAPFPDTVHFLAGVHKILLFSYRLQAFAAYENGTLIRWGPVSMGRRSMPTPGRLYHTNWKAKQTVSTDNEEWIMNWYFNLENKKGISMHEYDLPGYPASHACIRLLREDARWLYHWADQWIAPEYTAIAAYGTPVVVFGNFAFGKRRPWRTLEPGNRAPSVSVEELQREINGFLPAIRLRQDQRDSLLQSKR